jgi:hypothetical protein
MCGNRAVLHRCVARARDGLVSRPAWARPLALAGAAVIVVLAVLSYRQVQYWKDNVALWEHTWRATGPNYRGQTNLGFALADAGRQERRARGRYREALRINPSSLPSGAQTTWAPSSSPRWYSE